jgi:Spy/CpxP family protein refolding chaperone
MTKLKVLAGIALLLAYAAGIATGWAGYTLAGEAPPPPRDRGSWLSHELGLSPEQKEHMERIWSREARGDDRSSVRDLYDARNNEVRAMLTEEQKVKFDAIYRAFEEKREAVFAERRARHQKSVEETMAILNPEQQAKYRTIVEDLEKRGPGRDYGRSPLGNKE